MTIADDYGNGWVAGRQATMTDDERLAEVSRANLRMPLSDVHLKLIALEASQRDLVEHLKALQAKWEEDAALSYKAAKSYRLNRVDHAVCLHVADGCVTHAHELEKALLDAAPAPLTTWFPCPHCGSGHTPLLDSVDSGTTLTCSSCHGKTVVSLSPVDAAPDAEKEA